MLTHHADFHDIIDKAHAVLQSVGLDAKADELAANLSHGEQRNLEIGIALATEPQLLCLDEPTAGMSAAETHDTMELVRRIAKDLTILIVEHDMQVVMELAQPHHRAALRRDPGRRNAGGDPAEPQGAGGLPQDMTAPQRPPEPLVTVEDLHTFYGKSHILHGVSLSVGRGEVVGLLGRNGVGKSTTLKTIMGLVSPSQGKVLFEGKPITGMPAHKIARLGIAYVPEDRRIFKLLTVMENLRTGLDRSGVTDAQQAGAAGQGVRVLSGAGRAAQPGGRHAVGRRAADAGHRPGHDARAQDHPARRADRRPDAAHGLADQGDHRRAAPGGRRDPAGGAERAADARGRASASTSWRRARSATTPSPRSSK